MMHCSMTAVSSNTFVPESMKRNLAQLDAVNFLLAKMPKTRVGAWPFCVPLCVLDTVPKHWLDCQEEKKYDERADRTDFMASSISRDMRNLEAG